MSGVFLSYRRDDTSGYAGRLYDRLAARLGAESVFRDIDALSPGVDFVEAIETAVASCRAVVVLIGREWLRATTPDGRRRLDQPDDFVRLEVEAALARGIRIIPVLVEDATMPATAELPLAIARLSRFNALEISDSRWEYDVGRLIDVLDDTARPAPTPAPAIAAPPVPPTPIPALAPAPPPSGGLPLWARISVPAVLAVILAAVVVLVAGGGDGPAVVPTSTTFRPATTAAGRVTTTTAALRTVALSNVFALDEATALQRLRTDGVTPEAIRVCSNSVAAGRTRQVVLTDRAETELVGSGGVTAAGRAVTAGARVTVKVSTGPCATTTPTAPRLGP